MKRYKVLAINAEGDEIQCWFETKADAEEYAGVCKLHGCCCIHVAEFEK